MSEPQPLFKPPPRRDPRSVCTLCGGEMQRHEYPAAGLPALCSACAIANSAEPSPTVQP